MKATHIGHNDGNNGKQETFFGDEKLTGFQLEKECQDILYNTGHSCLFRNENIIINGNTVTQIDTVTDGYLMDIASVTVNGNDYFGAFKRKVNQIERFLEVPGQTEFCDTICLYFHEPNFFSLDKLKKTIDRARRNRVHVDRVSRIYCVLNKENRVLVYEL